MAACVCAKLLQSHLTLCDPWTVARQAPLSMGFSRQEYWSGLPRPPSGDLPDPGVISVSLMSPALAVRFFTTSATWEALSLPLPQCPGACIMHVSFLVCRALLRN